MHQLNAFRTIFLIFGFALLTFGCATGKNQINENDPRAAFIGTWNFAFDFDDENDHIQYVISADKVQYNYSVGGTVLSYTISNITWIPESDPYSILYPDYPTNIAANDPNRYLYQYFQSGYIIQGTITANSIANESNWLAEPGEIKKIPITMHENNRHYALIALDFCVKYQ